MKRLILAALALVLAGAADQPQAIPSRYFEVGLQTPVTLTTAGAPGLTKAIDGIWPKALRMRCWFPKLQNLQQQVPPQAWPECTALVADLRDAPTVPEAEPFVFVWLQRGDVQVFLNAQQAAAAEYPELAANLASGSWTMFIVTDAVDELHAALSGRARVVMPLETKFYVMREFAITDPDGFVITFAERVAG